MVEPEPGTTIDGFQSTMLTGKPAGVVNSSQSGSDGFAVTGHAGTRQPVRELQSGDKIGRYVILTRIGHGGMGIIYEAQDPDLDRRVALKFLLSGDGAGNLASARLLREAQSLAQLSHPNIVAVHDVGVFDDRVWIAMEFLDGPNLAKWILEKPRSWREVLPVFLQAGAGLQAAHAAGFVHRDFKPENVMFGREGRVRVVDFGLARVEQSRIPSELVATPAVMPRPEDARLTMTGSLLGTPRYMAREQWNGALADAKSDQFSFCVALWEAIFGEPPFAGTTLPELISNVEQGHLKMPDLAAKTPGWVRAVLIRGLDSTPAARWPSMAALLGALQVDPRRRARSFALAATAALASITALVWWLRGEAQLAVEVDSLLASADGELEVYSRDFSDAAAVRTAAFAAFDAGNAVDGERLWDQYRKTAPELQQRLVRSTQAIETALVLDGRRDDVRKRLGEVLLKRAVFAEQVGQDPALVAEIVERLKLYDVDGEQLNRWTAPAMLAVTSAPPGAHVVLERFAANHHDIDEVRELGVTPMPPFSLLRGSYRLRLELPEHAPVLFPMLLAPAEEAIIGVSLPLESAVPEGYIYVPPGRFLYGSNDSADTRAFLRTEPMRSVDTGHYLIARDEVTYEDYIQFLTAQPQEKRAAILESSAEGPVRLEERLEGGWRLILTLASKTYSLDQGSPLVYEGRMPRASVKWEQLPVTGITSIEATAYLAWLDRSGRVPGARYCNEYEWERAARGADGRLFASGDELDPKDANFIETYGKADTAFGPDPVGSYPQTMSPFGLRDTDGNAFELVTSPYAEGQVLFRGGSYFYGAIQARTTARLDIPQGLRDTTIGLRVCATWPPPAR